MILCYYSSLDQIVGKYKNDNNREIKEYFEKDGLLWEKNEIFGESYEYVGENKFEYGGMPIGLYEKLQFNFKREGPIKLVSTAVWRGGKEIMESFTKI